MIKQVMSISDQQTPFLRLAELKCRVDSSSFTEFWEGNGIS